MYIYELAQLNHVSRQTMNLIRRSSLLKTILYFLSPFILAILICFIGFLIDKNRFQGDTKEWSHFVAGLFFPAFLILGAADLLVRLIIKERVLLIWLIELTLLLFIYFVLPF